MAAFTLGQKENHSPCSDGIVLHTPVDSALVALPGPFTGHVLFCH